LHTSSSWLWSLKRWTRELRQTLHGSKEHRIKYAAGTVGTHVTASLLHALHHLVFLVALAAKHAATPQHTTIWIPVLPASQLRATLPAVCTPNDDGPDAALVQE
jgi:hypothetical protein